MTETKRPPSATSERTNGSPSRPPAVFVVGSTAKHCSIRIDPYTRQLTLFQQLNGQGYVWELVFGATRSLVEQGKMQELSGVEDPAYTFVKDVHSSNQIRRTIVEYKKEIDIATWARVKEYLPAGRRPGEGKKGALRLEGEFLNVPPKETRRVQHFDIVKTDQLQDSAPKLLVVYDDGEPGCDSKLISAPVGEQLTIVQTDGARNLWYPQGDSEERLRSTLFVTRSRVFSDAPQYGLGISTHLSLDKTLSDLRQLINTTTKSARKDPRANFLRGFRHLLIRLDCRATVYLSRESEHAPLRYKLMFIPKPRRAIPGGYMLGYTTILTACLVRSWVKNPRGLHRGLIEEAVGDGFELSWRHVSRGFCEWKPDWAENLGFGDWNTWVFDDAPPTEPQYPLPGLRVTTIEGALDSQPPWRANNELASLRLRDMAEQHVPNSHVTAAAASSALRRCARDILEDGPVPALEENGLPFEVIGNHVLVSSAEIDGFRALRMLFRRHMEDALATKPFNIAVFGAPGSGKSFGVAQVAASLKQEGLADAGPLMELNLSQFQGPQDLCKAFHRVRNELLGGRVPLVFFDEFDCAPAGEPYGWLKLFLAPMQDGKFRDGESEFNLGRPIFVFAGGTNRTFRELSGRVRNTDFVAAKGPDFISRLRWHVDIAGIDKADASAATDGLCELRRAILIRGLLERRGRWRKGDHQMPLDDGLIQAFLGVPKFHHGARSIEAILSMCGGQVGRKLRVMDLPPAEHLDMHVDAREFLARARAGAAAGEDGGEITLPDLGEESESKVAESAPQAREG